MPENLTNINEQIKTKTDRKIVLFFALIITGVFLFTTLASVGLYLWYNKTNKHIIDTLTKNLTENESEKQEAKLEEEPNYENYNLQEQTPTPTPTPTPTTIPSPSPNSTPTPKDEYKPGGCYRYTIYEGPFKSSKCYTQEDYSALQYYLSKYRMAEFAFKAAESSIKFTCDKDFFKEACEEAKEQRSKSKKEMEKYANEINKIISRGW